MVQGMKRRLDATIAVQGGYRKVQQNTDSKVLKLIVYDSANFGRHLYSKMTSIVAYGTILITLCFFLLNNASKSNPKTS